MQQQTGQLEKISQKFYKQKHRLPKDIAWKLQYMLDYINKTAKPIKQLTEEQKNEVKDLEDMNPTALIYVFTSIVNSILSPNLYSSFYKNCKIKLDGLMSKWITVYISFQDKQICFSNRKKIFRFVIEDLECHWASEIQLQLKYKGVRKSKIKFENEDSAKSVAAQINKLIEQHEKSKKKQSGEEQILSLKHYQQSLKRDYIIHTKQNDNIYLAHKMEPKIHVSLFLKGQFWNIFHLSEFLVTQKLWNSRVADEKIYQHDNKFLLIERRWQSSSFFSLARRTLTFLTITKKGQNTIVIEQKNYPISPTTAKNMIVSDIHIKIILDTLSPKIVKMSMDCLFNAKGYCNTSSSRSMLIDLFNDIMGIQDRFKKLKDKGKLHYKLCLIDRAQEEQKNIMTSRLRESELKKNEMIENKIENEQVYYSIATNSHYLTEGEEKLEQQPQNIQEQLNDPDQFDDMGLSATQQTIENQAEMQQAEGVQKMGMRKKQQTKMQQKSTDNTNTNSGNIRQNEYEILRPLNYDSKISLAYIRVIKQKVFEKNYLKLHFNQKPLDKFAWETPWYDPSIIINNGIQYEVSNNKQLIFINYDLIKSQKDSLIFVIKQVGANLISGKSVLNVSLPVDIFESRSLLQRSAASFACAPKYLIPVADSDPYTQMKAVVGFMLSVSPLQLIMLKPFNPILGETFQAYIGGVPIVYQQISHHPPISAYYMTCNEFTIYGNLVAVANVSLNSGTGGNAGKMRIIMKNGNVFQLSFFPAQISGLIYGKRKYTICNKAFVLERKNRLVAEISAGKQSRGVYEWKSIGKQNTAGDIIGGIFQVKQKFFNDNPFEKSLMNHSGLKKSEIELRKQLISGVWFQNILIGDEIINKNKTAYPVEYSKQLLPSDSNFRMDILLHRFNDLARSQSQKQLLEGIQRKDRKLRQTKGKIKSV